MELMSLHDLKQHVLVSTHEAGHTLDLIFTRTNSEVIALSSIEIGDGLADHAALRFSLTIAKPRTAVAYVMTRNLKKVVSDAFWTDFWVTFTRTSPHMIQNVDDMVKHFNETATQTLEMHAPLRRIRAKIRGQAPWYNPTLRKLKRHSGSCEKKWRLTGLEIDRTLFTCARNEYVTATKNAKATYLRNEVVKNRKEPKALWSTLADYTGNSLKMGRLKKSAFPVTHGDDDNLATIFGEFFIGKISVINSKFKNEERDIKVDYTNEMLNSTTYECFDQFATISEQQVGCILRRLPSKRSPADVLPLSLLRDDKNFVRLLSAIINESLESGMFPEALKTSTIVPVLKKAGLDVENLSNFRPVANIAILSKIIEKVVATQLNEHLKSGSYIHSCQSAYRRHHSTETALLRVTSDWRHSLGMKQMVCVVSLDVSSAFDTVSHKCLIRKLQHAGVAGVPLAWFSSYLQKRSVCIKVRSAVSENFPVDSGVPQGSVLGPILFNIYMAELAHKLTSSNLHLHIYADDIILYEAFVPSNMMQPFSKLQQGLDIIDKWMVENHLMLNSSKTKVYCLRAPRSVLPALPNLTLQGEVLSIENRGDLKWLGVDIDMSLSFASFIQSKCQAAFHQVRVIRYVRSSLDEATTLLLINALVVSRLDYCDSLLVAVPDFLMKKVQRVWNAAARIVTGARKHDHLTQIMQKLKWLPARQRTRLKVLRLVFLSLHGKMANYLQCVEYTPRCGLRSQTSGAVMLKQEVPLKIIEEGRWEVVAPKVWNALPSALRTLGTYSLCSFMAEVTPFL